MTLGPGTLRVEERGTFLHFHDESCPAGSSKPRARSADSLKSSSASASESSVSNCSSTTGPEGFSARQHQFEQLRKKLAAQPGSAASSNESAGVAPVFLPHSRPPQENDLLTDKHFVWESRSNTESQTSASGFDESGELGRRSDASKGPSNQVTREVRDNTVMPEAGELPPAGSAKHAAQECRPCKARHKNVRPETVKMPSVGSAKHDTQECRPCHYHFSKGGCKVGEGCPFCHFPHPKRPTNDIPRKQRDVCRSYVQLVHVGPAGSPEKAEAEAQLLSWIGQDCRIGAYAVKAVRCYQGPVAHKEDLARFMADIVKQLEGRQFPLEDGEDDDDADATGNSAAKTSASADVTSRQDCHEDCSEPTMIWTKVSL